MKYTISELFKAIKSFDHSTALKIIPRLNNLEQICTVNTNRAPRYKDEFNPVEYVINQLFLLDFGAIDQNEFQTKSESALTILNDLLKHGASAQGANPDDTPLHRAATFRRQTVLVPMLLHYNADPNGVNDVKRTPLHDACRMLMGNPNVRLNTILQLIQAGANVNAQDITGKTPARLLTLSAKGGPDAQYRLEALKLLIRSGADLSIKDKNDICPLDVAKQETRDDLRQVLNDVNITVSAIIPKKKKPKLIFGSDITTGQSIDGTIYMLVDPSQFRDDIKSEFVYPPERPNHAYVTFDDMKRLGVNWDHTAAAIKKFFGNKNKPKNKTNDTKQILIGAMTAGIYLFNIPAALGFTSLTMAANLIFSAISALALSYGYEHIVAPFIQKSKTVETKTQSLRATDSEQHSPQLSQSKRFTPQHDASKLRNAHGSELTSESIIGIVNQAIEKTQNELQRSPRV